MMKMVMIPLRGKIATSCLKEFILCRHNPPHSLFWISQSLYATLCLLAETGDFSFGGVQIWLSGLQKKKKPQQNKFKLCVSETLPGFQWEIPRQKKTEEHSWLSRLQRQWSLCETKEPIKISETLITSEHLKTDYDIPVCLGVTDCLV